MKRITFSLTILLFILSVPLSLPAAGEEHQASGSKAVHEKEAYEKSMQERLGKLGAQLDELKKKADVKKGRAEAQMKVQLAEAEKKRQAAARKLEELRLASKDSWKKFSAEAEKAAKDFEQAFERAKPRKE
jgi:hypothetical protein